MDHYLVPPTFIGAFDLFFFLKDDKAVEAEVKKILARRVSEAMTPNPISIEPKVSMSEVNVSNLRL